MTANASLLDSCRTIFIRQEISLHSDPRNKTAIRVVLVSCEKQLLIRRNAFSTSQTIYVFNNWHGPVFLLNSREFYCNDNNFSF